MVISSPSSGELADLLRLAYPALRVGLGIPLAVDWWRR
jgi:hypothetical protein